MITFVQGDIFKSPAQVITNTVNCVGVMGAGLALQFKNRYPKLFQDYQIRCQQGKVTPGSPYLYEDDSIQVLNFPTKDHWKQNSKLEYISDGLKYLAENHQKLGIFSLALPPLGCGLGGLNWSDVKNLMIEHLADLPDLEVFVYEASMAKTKADDQNKNSLGDINSESGFAAQGSLF